MLLIFAGAKGDKRVGVESEEVQTLTEGFDAGTTVIRYKAGERYSVVVGDMAEVAERINHANGLI